MNQSGGVETSQAWQKWMQYLLAGPAVMADLKTTPQQMLDGDPIMGRAFCAAYFMSDPRPATDLGVFLFTTVPMLLRSLQRTTSYEREEYVGRIRGKVDWPATYKARYRDDYNPALFVCRDPQRRENTPENQLLKYLIKAIYQLLTDAPVVFMEAEYWSVAVAGQPGWLADRVKQLQHGTRSLLAYVRLRDVEVPETITPRHILRARTSKTELYILVAQLYEQYEQLVLSRRWERVRPIFRYALLLPKAEHELSDSYIRLAAAGFLETS